MWAAIGSLFIVVSAGCSADTAGSGTTLPLADSALDDPDVTTVASVLAPSQITGSTVRAPATPPPCGAEDVELWTAAVRPTGVTVDAIVRVRNVGDGWCEADIGRSPMLDPAIEPDVWLQPGDTADLVVGQAVDPCDDPAFVTAVQVGIGDTSFVVPSALVTCGWWLTAFYPTDSADAPCGRGDLDVVATAEAVVIGTPSSSPCMIDALTAVDGAQLVASTPTPTPTVLLPGDVVAVGRPGGADCEGSVTRTLRFGTGLEVVVDGVPCGLAFEPAPPSPWFGSPTGPSALLAADAGIDEILDVLDPFGRSE